MGSFLWKTAVLWIAIQMLLPDVVFWRLLITSVCITEFLSVVARGE